MRYIGVMLGLYGGYIGVMYELYWDDGKQMETSGYATLQYCGPHNYASSLL